MYRVIGGANGIPSIFSHDGAFGILLEFAEDYCFAEYRSLNRTDVDCFTGYRLPGRPIGSTWIPSMFGHLVSNQTKHRVTSHEVQHVSLEGACTTSTLLTANGAHVQEHEMGARDT
jgi:hypothetical protein